MEPAERSSARDDLAVLEGQITIRASRRHPNKRTGGTGAGCLNARDGRRAWRAAV